MKAQVTETVTIAQAKTALEQTAKLYFLKGPDGAYAIDRRRARPVCLMGPAGIGKTEIVRQVAEEQGLAFLAYSVTHHTRQSAIGLPRLKELELEGKTVPVTEYTMSEIIAEVYRVMGESGKKEGILFLDEFNCASETMRPIMLQLLQQKTFGPHAIPQGWMLVLAGNPGEYNASASALDAVTADRMRLLWLKPDYPSWKEYMLRHRVHPVVLSYLDDHRNQFCVFEKGADGTALVTVRRLMDKELRTLKKLFPGLETHISQEALRGAYVNDGGLHVVVENAAGKPLTQGKLLAIFSPYEGVLPSYATVDNLLKEISPLRGLLIQSHDAPKMHPDGWVWVHRLIVCIVAV